MLQTYVDAWRESVRSVLDLAADLDADDWSRPTDLPGWSVLDVVAHLAHLESVTAGVETDEVPDTGATIVASDYTDAGVAARRGRTPEQVLEELRTSFATRSAVLDVLPDPAASASPTPGGVAWTWDTLLRNRAVDAWSHEQDVRRAVGRPGSLDSPGAVVTTHTFAAGMPYVLGKKVGAAPGTSVLWVLTGGVPLEVGATVGDDGRARGGAPGDPTTTLTMTSETFTVLAAGRRTPTTSEVEITGSAHLAQQVLAAMTLTF